MTHAPAPALLALLACACATAPRQPATPPALDRPEFSYSASFRPSTPPDLETPLTEVPTAVVAVHYLCLDLDTARALDGVILDGPAVWTTKASALATFLRAVREGSELHATTQARPERWSLISPERQLAYVADFQFRGARAGLMADPVIELVRTGTRCRARGVRQDDGTVSVSFELQDCGRFGPLQERAMRVPGFAPTLNLQSPQVFTQELATEARLATDECLVLAWNDVERPERRRFALVTASPVPVASSD